MLEQLSFTPVMTDRQTNSLYDVYVHSHID